MRIERAGEVQFNALGEPTRQTDAVGRVVLRGFDASGRPTSVADGQGYRQLIERGSEGLACRLRYFQQAGLIDTSGQTTTKGGKDYPGAILDTKTQGASTCKY